MTILDRPQAPRRTPTQRALLITSAILGMLVVCELVAIPTLIRTGIHWVGAAVGVGIPLAGFAAPLSIASLVVYAMLRMELDRSILAFVAIVAVTFALLIGYLLTASLLFWSLTFVWQL